VLHLLRDCAARIDWERLLRRFGAHWRVLLAHLVLFGYVYPDEQLRLPESVLVRLVERLDTERWEAAMQAPRVPTRFARRDGAVNGGAAQAGRMMGAVDTAHLCRGALLAREQYLDDIERMGYRDARREPPLTMTARDVEIWTRAIGEDVPATPGQVRTRA